MSQFILHSKARVRTQVREQIEHMISRGGCRRGDRLPSYQELCKRFQVSVVTLKQAMDELAQAGIVHIQHGKGVFVGKTLSSKSHKLAQAGIIFFCSRRLLFESDYLMEIFQGILLQSELQGVDTRLFSVRSDGPLPPDEVETCGVDGVILVGVANEPYVEAFARHRLPVVVVDSASNQNLDHVLADNEQDTARVVEHLANLGHRRIAYIDGWSADTIRDIVIESSDVRERREGFVKAMSARGLGRDCMIYGVSKDAPEQSTGRAAALWKSSPERPTAVVAYDVEVAAQLARALHELNVHIPGDVSLAAVAGSDGEALGGALSVAFNRVNFVAMGRRAVEVLAERCKELRPTRPAYWRTGSVFHVGNSTAALHETTGANL